MGGCKIYIELLYQVLCDTELIKALLHLTSKTLISSVSL